MSNVTMSLQEYDELKKSLEFNKSIVDALLSVTTDSWNIRYFEEHPDYSLPIKCDLYTQLPSSVREGISSIISHNVEEYMVEFGIEGKFNLELDLKVGYVRTEKEGEE